MGGVKTGFTPIKGGGVLNKLSHAEEGGGGEHKF